MITLASGCSSSSSKISEPMPFETKNHLGDTSFSSYLNRSEHLCLGRKKVGDGEIGVFGAEKYFNGGMDETDLRLPSNGAFKYPIANNEPHDAGPVKPVEAGPMKPKLPTTPSVHSESSGNSQSAVVQKNITLNPPRRKTNKKHGRSLLASIRCNCACGDKNSVDTYDGAGESNSKLTVSCGAVEEKAVIIEPIQKASMEANSSQNNQSRKSPWIEVNCKKIDEVRIGLKREDCFSFPILSTKSGNQAAEKQRKSLEVFGSPVLDDRNSLSPEKRLTVLTGEEIEIRASSDGMCFETESDASSDLFEIESFTRNGNSLYGRQPSDGTSSCYAPSEASIEWSVVTASAADFPVASDSEDPAASTKARAVARKGGERRCSGILSGCNSQKAVRVAGDAHRINGRAVPDLRRHIRSEYYAPVTRLQAETRPTGLDSKSWQNSFDAHSPHVLYY